MSDKTSEEAGQEAQPQELDSSQVENQAHDQIQDQVQNLPGEQLAEKRQALNLTVEEVANRLNLAPRQIIAIENNDFGALPGMAVTRGFIRSYAKLLNVDSASLLAMLPDQAGSVKEEPALRRALPDKPFYGSRAFPSKKHSGRLKTIMVAAALVVLAIIISWKMEWLPETVSDALKVQLPSFGFLEKKDEAVSENEALPAPEGNGNEADKEAEAKTADASVNRPTELYSVSSVAKENTGVSAKADVPAAAGNAAADQSKDGLVLRMREESWIEIRDAKGKVLVSRLAKAGETESLAVTSPLDLKIGNVKGVEATLRGAPVELMPFANGNVARLTVK